MGSWWVFVALVWVSLVVPGPDFVVVVQAAWGGPRRGIPVALGAVVGLCTHVALAVLSLGAALTALPHVLPYLWPVGGLVLLWLGANMVRTRSSATSDPDPVVSAHRPGHLFLRGWLVNATNPKALLFFTSVLPGFLAPDRPLGAQVAFLGLIVVASAALWWTVVVATVCSLPAGRGGGPGTVATRVGGVVLLCMGVALLTRVFWHT